MLNLFFQQPTTDFQLRQMSRLAKIAPPSTKKYINALITEGIIAKSNKGIYPLYRAVRDGQFFKALKKWSLIRELTLNGFTNNIVELCSPDPIILFGSGNRGEDIECSDIDIAVIAEESTLSLKKYETLLHRKISLLFVKKYSELSKELKNNIVNGSILYGYLKVF